MQHLRAVGQNLPAHDGHIPGGGEVALRIQPAGVAERGLLHPQLGRPGVHLLHKSGLAAANQLGHRHGGVIGGGNADGPEHLIQRELLPRLQPDLAAAHVVGVFAHRHKGIQRQPAVMDGLKGQQQGHYLCNRRDGHFFLGIFLVQHPAAVLLDQDGGAAVEGECRSRCRREGRFHPHGLRGGRFCLPPGHKMQPHPLCRAKGQRKQPEAEHRRAQRRKISPFHSRTSPAVCFHYSDCILCKKRAANALSPPGKICYNRMVYFVFLWKGYLA